MARPIEFNRDKVLDRAMDIFWEKGYEATSLQDLIDSMNLSKSSFYNSFESKHNLFRETLRRYNKCMTRTLTEALNNSASGIDFIASVFNEIIDQANSPTGMKGCFLMNTASEFARNDPAIGEILESGFKKIEVVFLKAVDKAQALGEIQADRDTQALANFLVCNMSGLKTMAKAGIKHTQLKHIADTVIDSLKK
jgi:TetR/AcrR family transcriptional regulator, transcriptional repressor for nem operon